MTDRPRGHTEGTTEPGLRVVGLVCLLVATVGLVTAGLLAGPPAAPGLDGDQSTDDNHSGSPTGPGEWAAVGEINGADHVTVSYTTRDGKRTFTAAGVDPARVDARDGWAIVDADALPAALARMAGNESAGVVVVGEYALVGNLTSATVDTGDATLTVVAPGGLGVDPARKAGFLGAYLSSYDFHNEPNVTATLVAVPEALPARGMAYGDAAYVASPYFWDGEVGSVWLHEAVHTHQRFELDREMSWFSEASAEYLAYRIMQEQYEPVTNTDVRERLVAVDRHPEARLSEPSTWENESVDYRRGVRLLYAVDATIRAGSDGQRSLVDVVKTMNRREEPVTVGAFVRIVERHSGRDAGWVRRAISGSGPLDPYLNDVEHSIFGT